MRLAVGATCDLKEGAAALRGEAAAGRKGKKDTLAVSFCGSPRTAPLDNTRCLACGFIWYVMSW